MNVYYNPEKFGLEIVGEIDFAGSYEFDMFVVWRETATGRLGWKTDSGCSCPTPFESLGVDGIHFEEPWKIALKLREIANEKKDLTYRHVYENDVVNLIDKIVNA